MPVILEGLMTTVAADGVVNVAPMGPIVDAEMKSLVLRPFQTSTTYRNLKRTGEGVFHVTDDVELIARAAVGTVDPLPALRPASAVEGQILVDACRWYAVRVRSLKDDEPRTEIVVDVVDRGVEREFFGFNRAKHAVLEAAILATRVALLEPDYMLAEFGRLESPVQKTGGEAELRAFAFLQDYVRTATHAPHADWTG